MQDYLTDEEWQDLNECQALSNVSCVIDRVGIYDVLKELVMYVGSEREQLIMINLLKYYDNHELELLKTPHLREEYHELCSDTPTV